MSKYYSIPYEEWDFLNSRKRNKYLISSNTSEYKVWLGMLRRCFVKKDSVFKNYGGRGITVCDRWLGPEGFNNFYKDMGFKPSKNYSIDRIDNNGNYCSENCKWSTQTEQVRNTRFSIRIDINGVIKSLPEWVEIYNLDYSIIYRRIYRGWDGKEAILTPLITENQLVPGSIFNDWTILEKENNLIGKNKYLCQCKCGNTSKILKYYLVNNLSKMCRSCATSLGNKKRYKKEI